MRDPDNGRPRRLRPRPIPSRTSQAVAVTRAGFDRPHTPNGDPDAQARLCAGMRAPQVVRLRPHLEARTRFIDAQVMGAIGRGLTQIVILGAGYDDRALRFRTAGVRFFEVDHPDTQADKRRRLDGLNTDTDAISLVPADFRVDDLTTALAAAGQRSDAPTLFLVEGLLVYLDEAAIVGLLGQARARSGPASGLVATLAVHPDGIDSRTVLQRANAARPGARAEPWRTILPISSHLHLVVRSGWEPVEVVDDAALGTGAPPQRSLSVTARPASTLDTLI
jgi:methyltransferase (TIGR00027 family)